MKSAITMSIFLFATSLYANCAEFARGFNDVVPNRADTDINVGQDFDTILERGFITFAVYDDFKPFSWMDDDARGIDVEIARQIAEEIGVEARFNFFQADENVDADFRNQIWKGALIGGQISNVMLHAPYNKDLQCRNEFVVLGGQYYNEQIATAYRTDVFDEPPTTPFYRFHKVGVENHTISAFYLENFTGGALLPNIVHYPSRATAFNGLVDHSVDAVMDMQSVLEYFAHDANADHIAVDTPPLVNFSLNEWTLGVAVNFRYRELFYAVDGIIADMVGDGRMREIFANYGVAWNPPEY